MNKKITDVKVENNITYYSDGLQVYEPKTEEEKVQFVNYERVCEEVMKIVEQIIGTADIKEYGICGNEDICEVILENSYLLNKLRKSIPNGYIDNLENDESLVDLISNRYIWSWKVTEWSTKIHGEDQYWLYFCFRKTITKNMLVIS